MVVAVTVSFEDTMFVLWLPLVKNGPFRGEPNFCG